MNYSRSHMKEKKIKLRYIIKTKLHFVNYGTQRLKATFKTLFLLVLCLCNLSNKLITQAM